jgi:hypothetical protein
VSDDPVNYLKSRRLSRKYLRRSVQSHTELARHVSGALKQHPSWEDRFREQWGAEKFNDTMRLVRRYEELGEEQFKAVLFAELWAEIAGEPDCN